MKECYNTSKVLKQKKQLTWNLKIYADTEAIVSQMNFEKSLPFCRSTHTSFR